MTTENFCYWLQGWIELQNPKNINELQIQEIKNHLDLVFNKMTPKLGFNGLYPISQVSPVNTEHVYISC